MKLGSFLCTLGLGMAGGAAAAMILPRQPKVRQAVSTAADTIESAVESAKNGICGTN